MQLIADQTQMRNNNKKQINFWAVLKKKLNKINQNDFMHKFVTENKKWRIAKNRCSIYLYPRINTLSLPPITKFEEIGG